MKARKMLTKLFAAAFSAAVLAVVFMAVYPVASAQKQKDNRTGEAASQGGYGFTTGVVGIAEGQTARLTVWNKGKEAVFAQLRFVNNQGKVLLPYIETIQPGKSVSLDWPCCEGAGRVELQAQFGTFERRSIGLLVPTLQVIDNTTGANAWMIGPDGFTEIIPYIE